MSNNATRVNNPMKVITGPDTRWSYANVWEPKSINGGTPKYSVSLIIPKSDTVTVAKIKAAIEAAYQEGQSKLKGNSKSVPPLAAIKTPLRDGDIERPDDPAYANAYFINANSATAPGIVDADRNPVLTRSEVYSGVYGRASINLYAFNSNGNKWGVTDGSMETPTGWGQGGGDGAIDERTGVRRMDVAGFPKVLYFGYDTDRVNASELAKISEAASFSFCTL